ncbi:MAG: hypothetical protein HQL83_13100 [Magnetococcales bacterium]|nr:hypothetical protein [Magnetococcales bacterium]MBF0632799.1 hypothetical protein [Magnetococcales bacterium]
MAGTEPMLFAVEGARQAAQLGTLSGKTFTVGQVSSVGKGLMGNWLFLQPVGAVGAEAAKKTVAIKLEGARQLSDLSAMIGKTVTVAKSPMTVGGACNWLALHPVAGGAATVGGVAQGSTAGLVMVKLEGARQMAQLSGFSGQSFTVVPSPMMGGKGADWLFLQPAGGGGKLVALKVQANAGSATASSLVGKTFVLGKSPVVAGKGGTWLLFKPAGAAALAKGGAVAGVVAGTGKMATVQTVALKPAPAAAVAKGGLAGMGQGGASLAPKVVAGKSGSMVGTAAAAKAGGGGAALKGMGLGLASWGPAALLGVAVVGVGVYSYLKRRREGQGDEEVTVAI